VSGGVFVWKKLLMLKEEEERERSWDKDKERWIHVTPSRPIRSLRWRWHECVFVWKHCEPSNVWGDSHLPVAHHFTHALRVSYLNFIIFFTPKTRTLKNCIFSFEFWYSKICQNNQRSLNSDVTFCSDTFSYKFFFSSDFVCKSYAHFSET
jgi:hypothetical protein